MYYISNAFSLNMIDCKVYSVKVVTETNIANLKDRLSKHEWICAIGHADTADIVAAELGVYMPVNKRTIRLTEEDTLIVAQYVGPRLENGTTVLPEGAKIEYKYVYIE